MRRGDDLRMAREIGHRHLVRRAADVERAPGEPSGVERGPQRLVVDEVAARRVDEVRAGFHLRERRRVHQLLGLVVRDDQANDEIRLREHCRHLALLHPGFSAVA